MAAIPPRPVEGVVVVDGGGVPPIQEMREGVRNMGDVGVVVVVDHNRWRPIRHRHHLPRGMIYRVIRHRHDHRYPRGGVAVVKRRLLRLPGVEMRIAADLGALVGVGVANHGIIARTMRRRVIGGKSERIARIRVGEILVMIEGTGVLRIGGI